jgi:probable HAF family extracellular repeat protein
MKGLSQIVSIVTLLVLYSFATSVAVAQETCTFQDLELAGAFSSAGVGINDVGAVGGAFSPGLRTSSQAFLLHQGSFIPFMFPGSASSGASDINNQSQIVGSYIDASNRQHGFFVHSGGFQTVDAPRAAGGTRLMGINNNGDIVGGALDASGQERAFLLHRGKFSFFSFPGAVVTEAAGINVQSMIVGTYRDSVVGGAIHGFMVRNGMFTNIDFPGAINTFPSKVNDHGDIVGSYQGSDFIQHGFVLTEGRFLTIDKPIKPLATHPATNILGVNNLNQIVGGFSDSNIIGALDFRADCKTVF